MYTKIDFWTTNFKDIFDLAFKRNVVVSDIDVESGFSDRLVNLMATIMKRESKNINIDTIFFGNSYSPLNTVRFDPLYPDIIDIPNYQEFKEYAKLLKFTYPLNKTELCIGLDYKNITENGLDRDYVLFGAY